MHHTKVVLLVDQGRLTRWQADALKQLDSISPLVVFSCRNTRIRRSLLRHFLYYALRAVSFANSWAGKVKVAETGLPLDRIIEFESIYEGAWQRLPDDVIAAICEERPLAIIKFGLSLLRVPPELTAPILSFHHGDPDLFRGRPAGFYELLNGSQRMGQIVQVLSNELDRGAVVAFAETRTVAHSYRATLSLAYRHSPLLLRKALRNVAVGRIIRKHSQGRNYRLPSNSTVLRFTAGRLVAGLRHVLYGAFFEKSWSVGRASSEAEAVIERGEFPDATQWRQVPRDRTYSFYADPFYCVEPPAILVEAMNRRYGRGEIVMIPEGGSGVCVSYGAQHFSYPATVAQDGCIFVVPEIATWSQPLIYRINGATLEQVAALEVEANPRIVDPTFFWHSGRIYLFGNDRSIGTGALCLWSSISLFDRFELHPSSPVVVSPCGARMAGEILEVGGAIYRLGQTHLGRYGEATAVFQVNELGPQSYHERFVRELRFTGVAGPHTINWRNGEVVFDWYEDRFSPLAWLRRVRRRIRH